MPPIPKPAGIVIPVSPVGEFRNIPQGGLENEIEVLATPLPDQKIEVCIKFIIKDAEYHDTDFKFSDAPNRAFIPYNPGGGTRKLKVSNRELTLSQDKKKLNIAFNSTYEEGKIGGAGE